MKRKEREIKRNIEKLGQELENRKKLPNEEKKKIKRKTMTNIIILVILLVYLFAINIGENNLQTETFIMILKVLSIVFTLITIFLFEVSYKCNENEIILHSIEMLIITLFTMALISAYSLYYGSFYKVIYLAMIIFSVYYLLKDLIIIKKIKKNYYKSLSDIKTIVAKR